MAITQNGIIFKPKKYHCEGWLKFVVILAYWLKLLALAFKHKLIR